MRLASRRDGSQRAIAPVKLELFPNYTGQNGADYITFKGSDGKWYMLVPESAEDMKALLSEVHILHHNFKG